jgi:hypothetical protein
VGLEVGALAHAQADLGRKAGSLEESLRGEGLCEAVGVRHEWTDAGDGGCDPMRLRWLCAAIEASCRGSHARDPSAQARVWNDPLSDATDGQGGPSPKQPTPLRGGEAYQLEDVPGSWEAHSTSVLLVRAREQLDSLAIHKRRRCRAVYYAAQKRRPFDR